MHTPIGSTRGGFLLPDGLWIKEPAGAEIAARPSPPTVIEAVHGAVTTAEPGIEMAQTLTRRS
jgi:hypothetical protein